MDAPQSIPDLSGIAKAIDGLPDLGADPKTRRNRITVIDNAWKTSDGSVVQTARTLNKSYEETLGLLAHPVIKNIAHNDPRVLAMAQFKADMKAQGDKPYRFDMDPTSRMEAESERRACTKLRDNPGDMAARETLYNVTHAEHARSTRTAARTAQHDQER